MSKYKEKKKGKESSKSEKTKKKLYSKKLKAKQEKRRKKEKEKVKKIVYEPYQCEHITAKGKRCKKPAVGSGVLCEKHGGDPLIKENLIPTNKKTMSLLKLGKFDPAVHPIEYIAYSKIGLSKVQIAAKFEVSVSTLEDWFLRYQEMNIASEAGKALYEAYWLQLGHDNIKNTRFNTSLYKFITGNMLGYSEKQENKNFSTNIHGVLVVPGTCTEEEWEREAKKAQEEDKIFDAQYKELGIDD